MHPDAMTPHGLALLAYLEGDTEAQVTLRRDDGLEAVLPARHFFRSLAEFSPLEKAALDRCRGSVLDVGAGSGLHSLVLQERGLEVAAIDLSAEAVAVMRARGVRNVRCADVFAYRAGPFDTVLMLGHGIGMVEDLSGLDRFLDEAHRLIRTDGRLLIHSLDVRRSEDPIHRAYHEMNRRAGRYEGTTRIQFEYRGQAGPYCGWLHVDADTLCRHAERAGWESEVIEEDASGDYLAALRVTERGR